MKSESNSKSPSTSAADVAGTRPKTRLSPEYVKAMGRFAYLWAWPMVNSFNRRTAMSAAPEPGLRGGVLPNAPLGQICMLTDYISSEQRFVACPNQDVTYGMGYGSLDEHPVVMQVPDFGDRFWVYAAWDARSDSFSRLGKQYDTKPGFYLMVGPNWKGDVPKGISDVFRSSTELAAFCPRVLLNDTAEDRKAIQPILNQIMAYPLSDFDGKMKTKDWKKVPTFPLPGAQGESEIHWVNPDTFFDQLGGVLDKVPPLPGEDAIYTLIRSLLVAAGEDAEVKTLLKATARATEDAAIPALKQWAFNGPPAGNGWHSAVNNAEFGTDYAVRTAISKSNMYENRYNETKYIFTDNDADGKPLDGRQAYSVTFAAGELPPVDGFWSLTLYNEHHFFNPNPLKRFSLGTKSPDLKKNADGSLTLYAGATSPGGGKEANWLPAPQAPFSLYIRCYGPKQETIDGKWMPPKVQRLGAVTAGAQDRPVSVTKDNFARAMTDMAMQKEVEQGGNLAWHHHRRTMALSEQPAPLMNRDTVYSFAVLDGGGDVAITLPKNDGRYMSLHIMNHEHVTSKVFYGPGRYVIPADKTSDYFYANVRMQINDKDPVDVKKVNQYQDELKIEYLNGYKPRPFKATPWNMKEFDEVRKHYVALAQSRGVVGTMGTLDHPVSLEARNRGVAIATGLLPDKDAIYLTTKQEVEKSKTYKATYPVPELADPKLGFYSVTVYGDDQYLKTDKGSILSNSEIKLNPDGKSFDIYFVPESEYGKGKHANELIIPTTPFWTCNRIYMPGASVVRGEYNLPKLL